MKGRAIILFIVGIVCALLVGTAAGYSIGAKGGVAGVVGGSYEDGFNHARDLLAKSGLIPQTAGKINTLTGTVKSVDSSGLILTVTGRTVMNPLDPQGPTERRIVISSETKIIANVQLSKDEIEAANKKAQEDAKAGKPPVMVIMTKEEAKAISDISSGATVTVLSDEDVSTAATVKATKITIMPAASAPAAGGAPTAPIAPSSGPVAPAAVNLPTPSLPPSDK